MNPDRPARLDRPDILARLFHPRPEDGFAAPQPRRHDLRIPVAPSVALGARFHVCGQPAPNLLCFHGNGEIAADYDDLGALFNDRGLNLLVVDYRGYGRSDGRPSVAALLSDAHAVLAFTVEWLAARGQAGVLLVMGRSLGSAPALELAAAHPEAIHGLVLESAFAQAGPLLELLGVVLDDRLREAAAAFGHLDKIARCRRPTLVIHGARDVLIPPDNGRALAAAAGDADATLLIIPRAGHNDLFLHGLDAYLAAVQALAERALQAREAR